ncbi:MAG: LysR family transcriptional regulator [Bauldia sp.]|uniref:LysR family transcriptional regulator n=1 Tax=Bauldia sp. TaxID=2575872 RepID=UPI001DD74638|nr:LysR family transcriptional regulator [Bauldia sp.]MCB1497756.1 LysR family transcriptional regulator [Bauldia sp.]
MNWDDARYFLAVAREGQMLGASRRLGVSQALLSRRVAALEASVGTRLMDRTTRGCTLTGAGQEVFGAAERMEEEILGAASRLQGSENVYAGTIRIGAPDGFGSAFLAPRLGRLRDTYPELHIQLVPITRSFSLSQREADLAVMVGRPDRGRLRVRRLTDYTIGLYASEDYLARVGRPDTPDDLAMHAKVGYVDDLVYSAELQYANEFLRDWRSAFEVTTAMGQLEVVKAGGGIGALHDFMAFGQPGLVRLFPELVAQRTYWTVWHENMRAARRVAAVASFLDDIVREARAAFLPARPR